MELINEYPIYGISQSLSNGNIYYMSKKDFIENKIATEDESNKINSFVKRSNNISNELKKIENINIPHPQSIGSGMKKSLFSVKQKYKSKYY